MSRFAALVAVALLAAGWSSSTAGLRVVLDDKMAARPAEGYVWFVGLDTAKPVHTTSARLRGRNKGDRRKAGPLTAIQPKSFPAAQVHSAQKLRAN